MQARYRAVWRVLSLVIPLLAVACTGQAASGENQPAPQEVEAVAAEEDSVDAVEETKALVSDVEEKAESEKEEVAVEATTDQAEASSADDDTAEQELLAGTNIAKHTVPLDDIVFDTFNGRYAPLSEASESLVLQLRDAIPPIENPVYEDVEAADEWLTDEDIVLGYVDGDQALAYPLRILNYHEIVNEVVNGIPLLISYCPLCNSGIVYDRRLDGQVLEFGNTSALYQSDMVMYDQQTLSYWFQVGGEAVVGELAGQRLELLPTRFMKWSEWQETYPDSRVLSRDTGFNRPYDRDPFTQLPNYLNQGRFPFPVGEDARDPSLPAGERVIGLVVNDEARAYPKEALVGSVANDEVGDTPIAVAVDEEGTTHVFNRRVGDQTLTFEWENDRLVDAETGTQWNTSGEAVSGPLEGELLESLPVRFSFWFAFVAAFPEATVYQA